MAPRPSSGALLALAVGAVLGLAGCGGPSPSGSTQPAAVQATPEPSGASSPSEAAASSAPPSPAGSSPATSTTPKTAAKANGKYVFPVVGNASYARTHHDYPATDIMAPCGASAVSPVDGTILEVTRVDTWTAKVNAGATRGGLSVSILGADGVRYYGSHYSSINAGIEAGVSVKAGQAIAKVGKTGDASACHVHFGLSPACAKTGDWWVRRGVIWPWSYLDAWKAGIAKSPLNEIVSWQSKNGCPTKPTVNP
jgi:murein DD-endopeptidase MepM/ murein hydrolase activator NlpD